MLVKGNRTEGTNEKMESMTSIWLKDTSTNGTYLNWERLKKNSTAVKVCHGDIISFAAPPQHEIAFAFVFREVLKSAAWLDNGAAKRKAGNVMLWGTNIHSIHSCIFLCTMLQDQCWLFVGYLIRCQ
ncbi:uncharacterized protein LOC129299743, partial [Prosopis cineraria]|uniref:uncharacterized protein LOC129299743 n=1 Tax=Prosopis cineraria TaxID=364024 RepID=UPI00240EB69B